MSYQEAEVVKTHWPGVIPVSCESCRRFTTFKLADDHACAASAKNKEVRHVIETGDHFFSSTTAIIFWYEKLLISYRNGNVCTIDQLKYFYESIEKD